MKYDLLVIGAGSGGVRAARIAANLGAKVAIVENRYFGGTCVNVGCVPKKFYAYAAEYRDELAMAEDYGWRLGDSPQHDWSTLKTNKDRQIARLNDIYRSLLDNAHVTVLEGRAVICAPGEVEVAGERYQATHILIAVGGLPSMPQLPGVELASNSDDFFAMESLPESSVVVGGGYIACELAGILSRLGSKVTLVYRGAPLLRGFDNEVRQFVTESIAESGLQLRLNASPVSLTQTSDSRKTLTLDNGDSITAAQVFFATGRGPNVDGLWHESLAINTDKRGFIEVDEQYQTSVPGIYAVGDVIGHVALTPVAINQGMWLARHLFAQQKPAPFSYDAIATAVFCEPNIATVGLTQEQALQQHPSIKVFKSRFRPLKHSLGQRRYQSLMKIIVDPVSDRVLGIHVVGPEAGDIIQGFAVALKMGATKADLDATVGIHPTAAEELVTMRDFTLVQGV